MTCNEEIFKYLNPKGNLMFSKIKSIDLQKILKLLNKYDLSLRKNLNVEDSLTFGFEIEYKFKYHHGQIEIDNNDINVLLQKIDSKKR